MCVSFNAKSSSSEHFFVSLNAKLCNRVRKEVQKKTSFVMYVVYLKSEGHICCNSSQFLL